MKTKKPHVENMGLLLICHWLAQAFQHIHYFPHRLATCFHQRLFILVKIQLDDLFDTVLAQNNGHAEIAVIDSVPV